ncbi:MAG: bifunctional 4-hydroxy-2-oxoglutarate aldolase/2-dehydro-3-deoxy-phosphogluconate aldolase [Bacillota bacterium]
MHKWESLRYLCEAGLVPVIRAANAGQARALVDAVVAGGARSVEVTMTVPGALDLLAELASSGQMAGAGTVLDAETARLCLMQGARFLVTPGGSDGVIRVAHRYQVPVLVGAQTVTEVMEALEAGADIVKLFPGSHLGPEFLKALRGPLPQAPCMPTGGVSLENVGHWIRAGAVAVGIGGELTGPGQAGDYAAVTRLTRQFITAVEEARA